MRFTKRPLLLLGFLALTSCGVSSPLMVQTSPMPAPDLNHVLVTFIRSSIMSPTLKAELWHRDAFIGELKARSYVQYETTPGKHLFLAKSQNWSYLEATLQGGRHYVVLAKIYPGDYLARIELEAARPNDGKVTKAEIDGWLAELKGRKASPEVATQEESTRKGDALKAIKAYDDGRIVPNRLLVSDAW